MDSTLSALPVFPLTGMLLLPGTYLPLNIFEQRYRNLVEDVLAGDRLIGMVQPALPAADNFGPVGDVLVTPEIYRVGCVGQVTEWARQDDGRFLIVLEGTGRFRVDRELSLHRGYRRVDARLLFDESAGSEDSPAVSESLLQAALDYCHGHRIDADADVLAALPGRRLVNALAAALPFPPEEQQALLEAPTTSLRATMLLQLFEMSGVELTAGSGFEAAAPN